jgi:antirestriction protein ArdC
MPTEYEVITAKIVEKLEVGTVPWHKSWNVETGAPRNLTSGRPYRGINIFLLGCQVVRLTLLGHVQAGDGAWGPCSEG